MDEEVEAVVRWVNGTLAIDESLTLARHYAARANALLTELNDSEDRQTLVELIDFVVSRSH